MIEEIVIDRFRGIKQGKLDRFGQINVLIGPNNSGKSAILEMLYLTAASQRECRYTSEPGIEVSHSSHSQDADVKESSDIFDSAAPLDFDLLGFFPWERLWHRHGKTDRWLENPVFLTDEGNLEIAETIFPSLDDFKLISKNKKKIFRMEDIHVGASITLKSITHFPKTDLPHFFLDNLSEEKKSPLFSFAWYPPFIFREPKEQNSVASWLIQNNGNAFGNVLLFDFHTARRHFRRHFRDYSRKRVPDWYEEIEESLGRIYPELEGCRVEIEPDETVEECVGFIRPKNAHWISIDHFGDGTRHAFKVLAGLIALKKLSSEEEPGLFLWEDPELFMHPEALKGLLDEVSSIMINNLNRLQIFICTQSLELIAFLGQMIEENEEDFSTIINFYSLALDNDRVLKKRLFEGSDINAWLKSGFDPRHGFKNMKDFYPLNWDTRTEKDDEEVVL